MWCERTHTHKEKIDQSDHASEACGPSRNIAIAISEASQVYEDATDVYA